MLIIVRLSALACEKFVKCVHIMYNAYKTNIKICEIICKRVCERDDTVSHAPHMLYTWYNLTHVK